MLAHFLPFSAASPLELGKGIWDSYESAVDGSQPSFRFTKRAKEIMENWDEIYECEDARDAERLRRRQRLNKKMHTYTKNLHNEVPPEFYNNPDSIVAADSLSHSTPDHTTAFTLASFVGANWLSHSPQIARNSDSTAATAMLSPSSPLLPFQKRWEAQIADAVLQRAHARRARLDPSQQTLVASEENASSLISGAVLDRLLSANSSQETMAIETNSSKQETHMSWDALLAAVEDKFKLNERQKWCFRICCDQFQNIISDQCMPTLPPNNAPRPDHRKPLRFLMTGPGGMGKTHTITAFQHLMAQFDSAHLIRFLAPTGNTAVNLPDGQTIHKACGIKVFDDSSSGRHALRMTISIEKQSELRREWRNVEFLLVDEVSLVGAQLLGDLDLMLRCVREQDDWFGGINIIFAGDFFQLPPVSATALYTPIKAITTMTKKRADRLARERHGRFAWKQVDTVIELTDQKRMEGDREFAEAVLRLRTHEDLTQEDIMLFNTRVLKSVENPNGVDLADEQFRDMVAVVEANKTRIALNSVKAHHFTMGSHTPELVVCRARHLVHREDVAQNIQEICTGAYHAKLLGELELYIGAPVILKVRVLESLV